MIKQSTPLQYCVSILPHVSRTFAIGIDALSGEVKKSVLIGYLLCRIVDTIEDDLKLPAAEKVYYLQNFLKCFNKPTEAEPYSEIALLLTGDPFHIDLVKNTALVFQVYGALPRKSQKILKKWVTEMTLGMISFIERYPQGIRIAHMDEYKEYCYYVAGTVGFLLTEIWNEYAFGMNEEIYQTLHARAKIFGEALQSVNILKDFVFDAQKENSIYIPQTLLKQFGSSHSDMLKSAFIAKTESAIRSLLPIVYADLAGALEYVISIPKQNLRIRFFCILPLLLAHATLNKIKATASLVEASASQEIKITRKEVKKIIGFSLIATLSNKWLLKKCNLNQ